MDGRRILRIYGVNTLGNRIQRRVTIGYFCFPRYQYYPRIQIPFLLTIMIYHDVISHP
uniref:Uncharacterized protein n=1 Tax=Lepeophtheirus salmonis TaxID=72036 RepID=A0A0K2VEJ9_LEPSM